MLYRILGFLDLRKGLNHLSARVIAHIPFYYSLAFSGRNYDVTVTSKEFATDDCKSRFLRSHK